MFKCALIGGKPRAVKCCISESTPNLESMVESCLPHAIPLSKGQSLYLYILVNRSRGDAAETPELNTKMCILPDAGPDRRALRKLPRCRYCSRDAVDSVEGCTWIL